jgi:hypothetical protein
MVTQTDPAMGRFAVEIEVTNNDDVVLAGAGYLPPEQVRRITLRGVVDSGASRLVLPESAARQLGLRKDGDVSVRYADNRTGRRDVVTGIHLRHGNRSGLFDAVVEPGRDSALIGAIVMETLDLVIDCGRQALVPRDPDRLTAELE